ncbi:hypothetical protein BDP27DRAFT_526694 [Rhodocollybia butyracea]|uniref:HNH nuclease domain-containing protein n=1 Tax=Rhodocollybia butyracea TaxID=206335 RepID=A0A9P5U9V0_9AGAR|nr:hypothetical protein BDP27DRAFT_526694 [Rhodocollybia butyracea]
MSEGSTPPSPPTLLTTPGINVDSDSDLTPQEGSSDLEYDSESTSESESHSSALNDPGSTLHDNQDFVPPLQDSPDSQQVDATPPPSPIIQQVYATSPRNIFRQEMPSAQTRKLVRDAAPAGGRCVVTLVKIGKPEKGKYAADIAYCHAIARSILWSLIRTVEWYLGMAPGTLNVNSRYNIFLMRFDIHPWFDGMGFVWIPASLTLLHEMERKFPASTDSPNQVYERSRAQQNA